MAHFRQADGAEQDGVRRPRRGFGAGRHVQPGFAVIGRPAVQVFVHQTKPADPCLGRREHREGGVGDVDADAVAADHGDLEILGVHDSSLAFGISK